MKFNKRDRKLRQEDILAEMGIPNFRSIDMNNPIHVSSLVELIDSGRIIDVVVNCCYGAFDLSDVATEMYISAVSGTARANDAFYVGKDYEIDSDGNFCLSDANKLCLIEENLERHDPKLIEVIRNCKRCDNNNYKSLKIEQIPSYLVSYYNISDYDGIESVCPNIDTFKVDMIGKIALTALANKSNSYKDMCTSMELIVKISTLELS